MSKQRCWTCKHLNRGGTGRASAHRAYRCDWEPDIKIPDSVASLDARKFHVAHSDGATCPCWEPRKEATP